VDCENILSCTFSVPETDPKAVKNVAYVAASSISKVYRLVFLHLGIKPLSREGSMYYYMVMLGTLALGVPIWLLLSKIQKKNGKVLSLKPLALLLAGVFFVRYYFYRDVPQGIIGLTSCHLSPGMTLATTILAWLSYTSVFLLMLLPFYDIKALRLFAKYPVTVITLVQAALLPFSISFLMGEGAENVWGLSQIMYAVETALSLVICVAVWTHDKKALPEKGEGKLIPLFFALMLFSMPCYVPQVILGEARSVYQVLDLTPEHRIFLYMIPVFTFSMYFILRNKRLAVRDFVLTYLSIATMISFMVGYKYDSFLDPSSWPIHLCNTAMFLVPICMISKWNKLFYFTYFINVMGALLAMLMPNYGEVNMFSTRLVNFWINHYCAMIMPILMVALKIFERPKMKQFWYSMAWFAVYFVFALFMNAYLSNFSEEAVDFFFLNSDFIPEKLGLWAEAIFDIEASFSLGDLTFTFHPLYQSLFFLVYIGIAFGIWFVYEQFFAIAESHYDITERKKKIKLAEFALSAQLNGRSPEEPMRENTGICLELINFSKKYGNNKHYAVKDACLKVHGGEIFGFLGPNGAGKSTIIKSIVGIQPITGGSIEVCGYDVEKQPVMAKRQVGFVPDHYALYERLTGREYINYIADIYEVSEEDRNARIESMVKRFELEPHFDNQMRTYSHGMKQKIAIMAALVFEPKIWILDEPLTGLDPNSIFQVKECMREHAEKGNIVFFSSHIIDVVERICDRITIINHGQILVTETIENIEKICPLEDFYMNLINGHEKNSSDGETNSHGDAK